MSNADITISVNASLAKTPFLHSMPVVQKRSCAKTSFLQRKANKRISGEIYKEPFLDTLLTDLEQSSFSLILQNKEMIRKEAALTNLKRNSPLFGTSFAKTELFQDLQKRSSVKTPFLQRVQNRRHGVSLRLTPVPKPKVLVNGDAQLEQKLRFCSSCASPIGKHSRKKTLTKFPVLLQGFFRPFNVIVNLSVIKPFFPNFIPKFKIKRNRENDNLNSSQDSILRERNAYFCYARVYTPSHSEDKKSSSQKLNFFKTEIPQRKLDAELDRQWKLKTSTEKLPTNCHLLEKRERILPLVKIGDYIHSGEKIGYLSDTPIIISESGKILRISETQITIQKMQPVLFYSQAEIHVENNEWVRRGTPILTLAHQTLVTGDIVQGIPRIEQLFEASTTPPPGAALQDFGESSDDDFLKKSNIDDYFKSYHTSVFQKQSSGLTGTSVLESDKKRHNSGGQIGASLRLAPFKQNFVIAAEEKPMLFYKTLQSQVRETFRKKWDQFPLPAAVRQSLEEIQQTVVESIQKVYISQGVLIADKHIEIIVRQMTSKAQIFDGGSTGLLVDEILSLQQIENANISTPGQKALYLPVIMGLTRAALSSDSFVSAASFQETTRVLSRDAVAGKTDFLRGLKEKVIIGDLIEAGTGLDVFYVYSLFSKKIFENKFRSILNRKLTHKTLKKLVLTITDRSSNSW